MTVQADSNFQAQVPLDSLLAYEDSCLSSLVEMAVRENRTSIRLNCSAEVAHEVVEVIRLGDSYLRPTNPRLLGSLTHQLDYLGIRLPGADPPENTMLYIPSFKGAYSTDEEADPNTTFRRDNPLLTYCNAGGLSGWASSLKDGENWPEDLNSLGPSACTDGWWMTATIAREHLSAGRCRIICSRWLCDWPHKQTWRSHVAGVGRPPSCAVVFRVRYCSSKECFLLAMQPCRYAHCLQCNPVDTHTL